MPIAAAENEASESPQFRGVAANKAANQRADAREVAAGTLRSDKGRREKFDANTKLELEILPPPSTKRRHMSVREGYL